MAKIFSTREKKLRSRAAKRRQALKVNAAPVVRKPSLEEQNRAVIAAIEAKIKS
jgi:hypothetical protein